MNEVRTRNTLIRFFRILVFLAAFLIQPAAHAQISNIEVYQQLALECLPDTLPSDTVRVQHENVPAYIRSAVTSRWLDEQDVVLYENESEQDGLPILSYSIESPHIIYARVRDGIARDASLAVQYSVRAGDGRVIEDRRCEQTYADVVERRDLAGLENPEYPETTAAAPPSSWRRRYLEPVIVASATAVTVLLFFALRSKSTSTE